MKFQPAVITPQRSGNCEVEVARWPRTAKVDNVDAEALTISKTVTMGVLFVLLLTLALANAVFQSADSGGNRGMAASFSAHGEFAGPAQLFTAETYWPTTAITATVWLRFQSFDDQYKRIGYPLTLLADRDPNHFQFFLELDALG
jgi:hypothetical protein